MTTKATWWPIHRPVRGGFQSHSARYTTRPQAERAKARIRSRYPFYATRIIELSPTLYGIRYWIHERARGGR